MCFEIYGLDPAQFLSTPGLKWLKKKKVKLDLLTGANMLIMVEKGIKGDMSWYLPIYLS